MSDLLMIFSDIAVPQWSKIQYHMWARESDRNRAIALLEERVNMDLTNLDILRRYAQESISTGVQIFDL